MALYSANSKSVGAHADPFRQTRRAYAILSTIGAGGMGEVYKARDTRLDRTVAIKGLATHLRDRSELPS